MATLTLELPSHKAQTEFNLRRWSQLLADRQLAKIEGRIETDRHGHVIMMPPPAVRHGRFQSEIAYLLRTLLPEGSVLTECPISTADGVKGTDFAWPSSERLSESGEGICFTHAPEICVEIMSPSNTEAEIAEKRALYFDAGATEFWVCSQAGSMSFFSLSRPDALPHSQVCPGFPKQVTLK